MALTPQEWFDRSREAFEEVLTAMARHGIHPHPDLAFVPADAPSPYYEPATRTIRVGMPNPGTVTGRLYWLYAARVLGYSGVEEVVARQAEQLPFMIAHEVAHHLRQQYGAPIENDFREEQVANTIALAFIHEHPTYRSRLPAMRAAASQATSTLAHLVPGAAPYVDDFRSSADEQLVELQKLSADDLRDLRHVADTTDVALRDLLVEAGVVSAADVSAADLARGEAEAYFNARYMADLLEYGYFHMAWVAAFLARDDPPSLPEAIASYLLTADWERARRDETYLLLRQLLTDGPEELGPPVAEAIVEGWGAFTVADLSHILPGLPATTEAAVLRGWARLDDHDPRAAEVGRSVLDAPSADLRAAAAALLLRNGDSGGRRALLDLLAAAEPGDRAAGLRVAGEVPDPALVEGVAGCLRADSAEERRLALLALAAFPPDPALVPAVSEALTDRDDKVRKAAVRSAGRHLPPADLVRLLRALDDPVEDVRREFTSVVRAAGAAVAPALRSATGSWRARAEGTLLLHAVGAADAGARLEDLLAELIEVARQLGAVPAEGLLEAIVAEQRRKVCFLALRVIAATREGDAVDRALEGLRWADSSTRPGFLLMARTLLPPDLWSLLDGRAPAASGAGPATNPISALFPGFEPVLRELAEACLRPTEGEPMLSEIEKLVFLRSLPLFADVEMAELRPVAEVGEVFRYRAGERIFDQGDVGDRLYVITSGKVGIDQHAGEGPPVLLRELGPGASFGESAFFSIGRRTAGAFAVVDSTLLGLERESVLRAGTRHPGILLGMIRLMRLRMVDSPAAGQL